MDKNLKVEETIDEMKDKIVGLEKELQRRNDEVRLRKEVIDSMSKQVMDQDQEHK